MLVLFCPHIYDGVRMASIYAGVFAFNSSVYGIFPFLFPRASILVRSTSNVMANYSSPWNTKYFLTPCPNAVLRFPNAYPEEWIRIGYFDPCTMTRYVSYLSPVMIVKWASGFPAACDSTCIIYGDPDCLFFALSKGASP